MPWGVARRSRTVSRAWRELAASPGLAHPAATPQASTMSAISLATSTKSPAMKTDSATPPERFSVVWKLSHGLAVGAEALGGVLQAAAEVVVYGGLGARSVVVGRRLLEDGCVPGLLQVGSHRQHQPEGVVVEARADGVVAPFGQRLVLVVGAAAGQLGGRDVDYALAGALGDHVHEPEEVLGGVAKAHAPPYA